jgi:predicted RNA-binding Zn-ribbon protein involved in translation (DUF1610 family)
MKDWLKQLHDTRCGNKAAYRNPEIADRRAERASRKMNQLIVSYQCPDCGRWHIGHADHTQVLVRNAPSTMNCVECGAPIPASRLENARMSKGTTTTCSDKCSVRAQRRRNRKRRRARNREQPPGPEGGVPSPS